MTPINLTLVLGSSLLMLSDSGIINSILQSIGISSNDFAYFQHRSLFMTIVSWNIGFEILIESIFWDSIDQFLLSKLIFISYDKLTFSIF